MKTIPYLTAVALLGSVLTVSAQEGETAPPPPPPGAEGAAGHGGPGGPGAGRRGGPPGARLAELFSKLAAFDANKDGRIDTSELPALTKAIENREILPPGRPEGGPPFGGPRGEGRRGPKPPQAEGEQKPEAPKPEAPKPPQASEGAGAPPPPPAAYIAEKMSEHYAQVAAYDADHNGTLSEDEKKAIQAAIKEGKLKMGPGGPGGRGPGGDNRRGPKPPQ